MADNETIRNLALALQALGHYQNDSNHKQTETGKLFLECAAWLFKLSFSVCGVGCIGCDGGPDCRRHE